MIKLTFNTKKHTMVFKPDMDKNYVMEYPNVTTIKYEDKYYEVRQKQDSTSSSSVPIFRVPVESTIIEYIHS